MSQYIHRHFPFLQLLSTSHDAGAMIAKPKVRTFVAPEIDRSRLPEFSSLVPRNSHAQDRMSSDLQNESAKRILAATDLADRIPLRTKDLEETNQRLAELNVQLNVAKDQAIESSNIKSAFVANISHELRTPLSGVLGLNELLMESDLHPEQYELAKSIQECAQALLVIVNDILDLSKIEAGKAELQPEPFNLIFLLQDVAMLFREGARRKNLTLNTILDHAIPQFVIGDPSRLRQVLVNLVGNAIKFTEHGGVQIVATMLEQDEEKSSICFSVTDTGIGIAEFDRCFLFKRFSQVDNSNTRKYGGTGLGLNITKRLVDLMGGEIGLDSEVGAGSTFWFKISLCKERRAQALQKDAQQEPASGALLANKSILVVEDSVLIQQVAKKQLLYLGVGAQIVSNGREALDILKQRQFDVILMDCQMPEMDGFEATRQIRQLEAGTNIHTIIIAMTASAMVGDKEECILAGMDDYLSKPVTLDQLRSKLTSCIDREFGNSVAPPAFS